MKIFSECHKHNEEVIMIQFQSKKFASVRSIVRRRLGALFAGLQERLVPSFNIGLTRNDFGQGNHHQKLDSGEPRTTLQPAAPPPAPATLQVPAGFQIGKKAINAVSCWNPHNLRSKRKCQNLVVPTSTNQGLCGQCSSLCRRCNRLIVATTRFCEGCEEIVATEQAERQRKLAEEAATEQATENGVAEKQGQQENDEYSDRTCKVYSCQSRVPKGHGGYCYDHGQRCRGTGCQNVIPNRYTHCRSDRCQAEMYAKLA